MAPLVTHKIHVPLKPWTMNASRSASHWVERKRVALWRDAGKVLAQSSGCPRFSWVEIEVTPWQQRGPLADVLGHAPAFKACLDGIVDSGRLVDDSPEWVRRVTFNPPSRGADGLTLLLQGELMSDGEKRS